MTMIVVRFWVLAGVCQQRCSPPLNHVPMYFGFELFRDMVVEPNPQHAHSRSFVDIKDLANPTALDTRSNSHATVTGAEFTFCGFPCTDASRQNANASSEAQPSLPICRSLTHLHAHTFLYNVLMALTAFIMATTNLSPTILMNYILYNFGLFCS